MKMKWMTSLPAVVLAAASACAAAAQTPQVTGETTLHGHVQNAAGQPLKSTTVEFTTDISSPIKEKKWKYVFKTDDNGDYKGTVVPGTYVGAVAQDDKFIDFTKPEGVKVDAGDAKIDFDMTRPEYLAGMSEADKAALEEYKKKNAATTQANKVISNLNATLATVRADLKAAGPTQGDVSKDVDQMNQATTQKPDESILWIEYGDTLLAQGDHLAHEDKAANKPANTDDAVTKMYTDAIAAYQKGADLNAAGKKPVPAEQAAALSQMGNTYAKLSKVPEAAAAYDKAVALDPAKGGMYFGNESIVLYNNHDNDGALAAADKAIAADPDAPNPYYIKGQILIQKATVDASGKVVAPDGCVDAYQHFLGLAGDEPQYAARVAEVKQILQGIGAKIETKYKAAPTKKK